MTGMNFQTRSRVSMNRNTWKKAVMPTIVVTLIFFLNYWAFGMENTIIGPFLTLSFLKFQGMEDYRGCMLRSLGIYAAMALLAQAALLHPALCLAVNAGALFWIGYFLIDEYNPLNYFPAGMALIFFQNSPAPGWLLCRRLLALAVSFLLVFLFLQGLRRWGRKKEEPALRSLTKQGLDMGRALVVSFRQENLQEAKELLGSLQETCREVSLKLYEANRASVKKKLEENRFCIYLAYFQMIGALSEAVLSGEAGSGKVQLDQMEALLLELETRYEEEELSGTAAEEILPRIVKDRLRFRENPLDIRSFRLRFALRQMLVMTPCMLFGYFSPFGNRYWLAISVFFMMIPVYENTLGRILQRIRGSLLGVAVCLLAFAVFQGFWARLLLMTIANFFIYCSGNYTAMVTCITCSALALNFGTESYIFLLGQRLFYTFAGAGIALMANVWVFRIRASRQCQYVMELLRGLEERIQKTARQQGMEGQKEMNQMMVKSYLLASRMKEFNDLSSEADRQPEVDRFLKEHMQSVSGACLQVFFAPHGMKGMSKS